MRMKSENFIFFAVALFVLLIALAMSAYPGGTAWDPTTHGHTFWFNYLCDLARATALNGEPNSLGAKLAQAALLALCAGAMAFWWLLPRLFAKRRALARAVRILGVVSFAGMFAVALLPSDRFSALHPFLLALAGGPGLAAAACAVVGLFARERIAGIFGASALVTSAIDFALYAHQLAENGPGPMAVVVMERIALIAILAWMCVVAWRLRELSYSV